MLSSSMMHSVLVHTLATAVPFAFSSYFCLLQFYAMASFCNPKVFESPAHFRKYYDRPILAGREPGATDNEVQLATERQEEMNRHCNDFILRRTNDILSDHLPPKVNTICPIFKITVVRHGPTLPFALIMRKGFAEDMMICNLQPQDSLLKPLALSFQRAYDV